MNRPTQDASARGVIPERPRKRRARWARVAGVAVVLLVVGCTAVVWWPRFPTRQVPVPAGDAAPAEVVATFLEALDAHDCDTAATVASRAYERWARDWCADVDRVTEVRVEDLGTDRSAVHGVDTAAVTAEFVVRWRPFHSDGSISNGPWSWTYYLVRSDTGAWRITDAGSG